MLAQPKEAMTVWRWPSRKPPPAPHPAPPLYG